MREKRPRLPMPRRRLALLWLLAPCLLLLAAYVTDAYCFTPDQAQRLEEKRRLLEPMEALWQEDAPWEQEVPAIARFTANDRAVAFGEYTFRWENRGWSAYVAVTPRERDRPFTADCFTGVRFPEERELPAAAEPLWEESRSSLQEEFFYVYGCLESPEAAELVVEYEPSGFLPEPQPSQTVRLTAADWIWGPDGTAYFLCALEPVRGGTAEAVRITAYDRGGQPIGTRCVTGMDYWVE